MNKEGFDMQLTCCTEQERCMSYGIERFYNRCGGDASMVYGRCARRLANGVHAATAAFNEPPSMETAGEARSLVRRAS